MKPSSRRMCVEIYEIAARNLAFAALVPRQAVHTFLPASAPASQLDMMTRSDLYAMREVTLSSRGVEPLARRQEYKIISGIGRAAPRRHDVRAGAN